MNPQLSSNVKGGMPTSSEGDVTGRDLVRRLAAAERRRDGLEVAIITARRLAVVVAIVCAAMVFDFASPLGSLAREGIAIVALFSAAAIGLLARRQAARFDERTAALRAAVRAEAHADDDSNRVVNAVSLSDRAADDDAGLDAALSQRAVERGAAVLADDRLHAAAHVPHVFRRVLPVAVVAAVLLGAMLVQPRFVATQAMRLIAPRLDLPPFSFTQVRVTVAPDMVTVGDSAKVFAHVFGRASDDVELITLTHDGKPDVRIPLSPAPYDDVERPTRVPPDAVLFRGGLARIDRPVVFHVRAGDGRSRRVQIVPQAPTIEPPPAADASTTRQGDSIADTPLDNDGSTRTSDVPGPVSNADARTLIDAAGLAVALRDDVRALERDARQIQAMLDAVDADDASAADAIDANIAALRAQLAAIADRAAELQQHARAAAALTKQSDAAAVAELASSFESLAERTADLETPSVARTDGGSHVGGDVASRSGFARRVAAAAAHDRKALADVDLRIDQLAAVSRHTAAAIDPDGPGPEPSGLVREVLASSSSADPADRAKMQSVPAAYRLLVQAYFDALAEDDTR